MTTKTVPKMNPVIKKDWLEALRSDRFQQGRHHLKTRYGGITKHCCLGVLCEILGLQAEPRHAGFFVFDGHTSVLPIEVANTAGINQQGLYGYRDDGQPKYLTTLNDDGASFTDIADIIEENL